MSLGRVLTGLGKPNGQVATLDFVAVQSIDRLASCSLWHIDKSEALGTTGASVDDHSRAVHFAKSFEQLSQLAV